MVPVPNTPAPPPTLDEFLSMPEPEYDWLIPGLFERQDRIILTGEEGHGKSTLVRQFGVAASAGLDPFRLERINPVRTLLVELENSIRQTRRELAKLRLLIDSGDQFAVIVQPGLDLTNTTDEKWLEERIDTTRPDLLLIGPLYKLHNGDPNEEKPAKHVSSVLDRFRDIYGLGLLLEAHTPHASQGNTRPKRPYGASLWKRWPEFGLHIDRFGKLSHWRVGRDERNWPAGLQRGSTWPWEPTKTQDEFMPTHLMEMVSRLVEDAPDGLSKSAIRSAKLGKHDYVDQAADYLVRFGYLHLKRKGNAHVHLVVKPYREGDDLDKPRGVQATLDDLPEPY